MAERALTKKAPFHNSKNNMADALIYFGALEYVSEKGVMFPEELIFVTQNHKEFSEPTEPTKLNSDLNRDNVLFYNNLALALKMRNEAIIEMNEYFEHMEQMFEDWSDLQAEIARGK